MPRRHRILGREGCSRHRARRRTTRAGASPRSTTSTTPRLPSRIAELHDAHPEHVHFVLGNHDFGHDLAARYGRAEDLRDGFEIRRLSE